MSEVRGEGVPAVWMRERCAECGGSGEVSVSKSAGQARWSKQGPCPACEGVGRTARWVGLDELRSLLKPG